METKIFATYKGGVLIPENKLDLEDNSKVKIILEEDLYDYFSLAGQEDNIAEIGMQGKSFDFLGNDEDIYSEKDLI